MGLIPAFLKAKWNTNETIVTLMMNYIALKWITYLQYGPWKDPKAWVFLRYLILLKCNTSRSFWSSYRMDNCIILVIIVYIFMKYTKMGYEISVLGESEKTAIYAGINIKKTIIIAILLSGGIMWTCRNDSSFSS